MAKKILIILVFTLAMSQSAQALRPMTSFMDSNKKDAEISNEFDVYKFIASRGKEEFFYLIWQYLTPKERLIAKLVLGFGTKKRSGGYTMPEIATRLNIDEEEVTHVFNSAMTKLYWHRSEPVGEHEEAFKHDDVSYFESYRSRAFSRLNKENKEAFLKHYSRLVESGDLKFTIKGIDDLGAKLQFLRILRGLTHTELAGFCDCGRQRIEFFENRLSIILTKEEILKKFSLRQQTVETVKRMLKELDFSDELESDKDISLFLWGMSTKDLVEKWQVKKPWNKLRILRVLKGLSAKTLSAQSGVSVTTIAFYENNYRNKLSQALFKKYMLRKENLVICKRMKILRKILEQIRPDENVSLSWLLWGIEYKELMEKWNISRAETKLRLLRILHGLNQRELANLVADITRNVFINYESKLSHLTAKEKFMKERTKIVVVIRNVRKILDKLKAYGDIDMGWLLWDTEDLMGTWGITEPGQKIRILRMLKGWSQEGFAEKVGIDPINMIFYENEITRDFLYKEKFMGGYTHMPLVMKRLRKMHEQLEVKEDLAMFLWGKSIDELMKDWGISAPGAKLRFYRRLNGLELKDVAAALTEKINSQQIGIYERHLLERVTKQVILGSGVRLAMTIRRVRAIMVFLQIPEEICEFLFGKSFAQIAEELEFLITHDRVKFLLILSGQSPSDFKQLLQHLKGVRSPVGIGHEHLLAFVNIYTTAKKMGVKIEWEDIFPGQERERISEIIGIRSLMYAFELRAKEENEEAYAYEKTVYDCLHDTEPLSAINISESLLRKLSPFSLKVPDIQSNWAAITALSMLPVVSPAAEENVMQFLTYNPANSVHNVLIALCRRRFFAIHTSERRLVAEEEKLSDLVKRMTVFARLGQDPQKWINYAYECINFVTTNKYDFPNIKEAIVFLQRGFEWALRNRKERMEEITEEEQDEISLIQETINELLEENAITNASYPAITGPLIDAFFHSGLGTEEAHPQVGEAPLAAVAAFAHAA